MSHRGNGDSGNSNGGTFFGHTDTQPPTAPWTCAQCGHVERHPDPRKLRRLAKAHADTAHAEQVVA